MNQVNAEQRRLSEDFAREKNWKRWGPYLSERQWGTVREDYSPDGDAWSYFPWEQAAARAYRWGEDGLLGICDRQGRLCFALALWNERDPLLKERLFGLSGPEGNHGEDVKECYYYLDSTPTHSYMKALYKYPQAEFPYERLRTENRQRDRMQPEFELADSDVFHQNRYFDVSALYAKQSPNDILIRIVLENRGPDPAPLHVIPTLWFRNTWSWNCDHEGCTPKPRMAMDAGAIRTQHLTLQPFRFFANTSLGGVTPEWLFTDNETNKAKLFDTQPEPGFFKDAFHEYVVDGQASAVNPKSIGTKVGAHYRFEIAAGAKEVIELRLVADAEREASVEPFGRDFSASFARREQESDEYHAAVVPSSLPDQQQEVVRQSNAGLLWTKQFYNYAIESWLEGDEDDPPPAARQRGRNSTWTHLFNRDVISMPDKWEYPWYAAWDSAFHMIPFKNIDPYYTQDQLILFLREWYMHPNGQLPAYEWEFGDVNPPVHAWACLRYFEDIRKSSGRRCGCQELEQTAREFLARAFQKLLLNFTWWVNRKDINNNNIFAGGFLGLDNIGIFDRSKPLPTGGHLDQADGTAWVAFFCSSMLSIAFELAAENRVYADMASKFFEHFIRIAEAMNTLGGSGLWDEQDGFYYDHLKTGDSSLPLRIRSLVGLVPLFTVTLMSDDVIERLPGFKKRMDWFLTHRAMSHHMTCMQGCESGLRLMAIPSEERLLRILHFALDESEFLSPFGIRSLSKFHQEHPFVFHTNGHEHRVAFEPGESTSPMFGGNSNWRGPIWLPMNYLFIESMRRYGQFYGDSLKVECPTGSGVMMTFSEVADEIQRRLMRLFLPDANGHRPLHQGDRRYAEDKHWKDLVLFYEYFHSETGAGLGASHQTGWTSLVSQLMIDSVGKREH